MSLEQQQVLRHDADMIDAAASSNWRITYYLEYLLYRIGDFSF